MNNTETVDIDTQYPTVRALLAATNDYSKSIGWGSSARVYPFPTKLGLDDVVLRVRYSLKDLENTSSLYSPQHLLLGVNAGQALLQSGSVEQPDQIGILLKHHGTPLNKLLSQHPREEKSRALYNLLIGMQEKSGTNPLIGLLRQAIQFHMAGFEPDLSFGNIFVNEETHSLELIDQLHGRFRCADVGRPAYMCLEGAHQILRGEIATYVPQDTMVTYDKAFEALVDMVIQADKALIGECFKQGSSIVQPYRFAAPDNSGTSYKPVFGHTCSTQAISLDDPPHVLVERLRELKGFVNAPSAER